MDLIINQTDHIVAVSSISRS